ncbi:MAG: peptide chain release factor N(5)-glutamine methyltransferase [Kiritimatiellia bacterium]
MTCRLIDFLHDRTGRLERKGGLEARLNVQHLAARRLGIPRLELAFHQQDVLTDADRAALDADVERLAAGEPLQYVLGDVPFHGLTIRTDRRALIPRPETERLAELVLACEAVWKAPSPRVADIGAGTGCLALALAAARPRAWLVAVDCSPDALSLARENRERLGLADRVEIRQGDLLDGLPEGAFDAVVSNPPYIASAVCRTLDPHVRNFEPLLALDGGGDGLAVIRRLVPQALRCLKPGRPLWLETGCDQGEALRGILARAGFERVEIRPDFDGHDRFACGWRPM